MPSKILEEKAKVAGMRLITELVYCAALGHRQIVKLSDADQLEDGRFVCRTCRDGQMALEVGQRKRGSVRHARPTRDADHHERSNG